MFSGFSKNRDFLSTGYDTFCEYGLKKKSTKNRGYAEKTFEVSMRVTGIKWVEIGEML